VFAVEERERVRRRLIELAEADPDVSGAAIVGSHAQGQGDRWSDIDLAFAVSDVPKALARWTDVLEREFQAVHHWDLPAGVSVYRVFLLPGWLEVDIGFKPASDFGARGPSWQTVFGETVELTPAAPPSVRNLAGLSWHHAYHAHVCIQRQRWWQAEHWISELRGHAMTLACLRFDLPAAFGKTLHLLPQEVTGPFQAGLVRSLDPSELRRALREVVALFQAELGYADSSLAGRLEPLLAELSTASGGPG
jgi:predicted nucleotidyltransferase